MPIEIGAYSERAWFEREIETIFAERYYVGRADELPERDCYRSFVLGNRVISVRNTGDGIKAFGNVCLHRSNLIDPLGNGKRHFSCGFHGWSYDERGELSHAPMTDKACIARRNLPTYPLSEAHGLLFLATSGNAVDTDKLGLAIEHTGIALSPAFHSASILHKCNWKLLIENILESYHLNFVHRNTFLRSGFNSTSTHEWSSDGPVNIASIMPLPATSKLKTLQRLARNATHSYRHAYVFPNLFISSTNDLIGYIGSFRPIDEKTTLLSFELFELPELLKLPLAVRDHMRKEAIDFAVTTLEEDREMIEACQIGVSSRMASVQLQPLEDRVAQFHQYYNERMSHAV